MKKIVVILFVVFNVTLSAKTFDLSHSLSVMNAGPYWSQEGEVLSYNLLKYRVIENYLKVGCSISLANFLFEYEDDMDSQMLDISNYLSLELNWDPFITDFKFWGVELFTNVNQMFYGGIPINYRVGSRVYIKHTNENFSYHYVNIEAGYSSNYGFFCGLNLDITILAGEFLIFL